MDEMVQELLGANGGTFKNPATNLLPDRRPTRCKLTENVAQVFMGMRIQCAQCHNHPFDRWTKDDYYGFAAFFAQIGRKQGEDYRETIVFNSGGGEVNHPVGGRSMKPKFLGGDDARRRRARTAAWCWPSGWPRRRTRTSPPTSPTASGPTSSARASSSRSTTSASATPPSTPSCSRSWASSSPTYKYDFKTLVRDICTSRTYQRVDPARTRRNAGDERNFAHANDPPDPGRDAARHASAR